MVISKNKMFLYKNDLQQRSLSKKHIVQYYVYRLFSAVLNERFNQQLNLQG